MEIATPTYWRKCTSCKKLLPFGTKYWVCSVSTCNRQRTGLVFCSVACFDAHVPVLNHRDAGAFEKTAPSLAQWQKEQAPPEPKPAPAPKPTPQPGASAPQGSAPRPTPVASAPPTSQTPSSSTSPSAAEDDILVVVSKVKAYIRARSEMSTSDSVMELLSERIRVWSRDAIRRANQDGRKTVMDRDYRK